MAIKWRVRENPGTERDAQRASAEQSHQIAHAILRDAQANCPVRTGNLRASGYVIEDPYGNDEVGFSADYAAFVSEGTSRQPANDFFTAAVYKHRSVT